MHKANANKEIAFFWEVWWYWYYYWLSQTHFSCLLSKGWTSVQIWGLHFVWKFIGIIGSECNGTRTHNQLVRKRTLNHLAKLVKLASSAKWLNVRLPTKSLWVRVPLHSLNLQILRLLRPRSSLTFRQL